VAATQVRRILDGAVHRGLDVAPLLARAGIAPQLLEQALARVSQQQYALLLRVLRRALRDELWGLTSRPLRVGSFGQCAARLVQCRTLHEALREGLRHFHGLIDDFVARLSVRDGVARVRIATRMPPQPRLDYAQKAFLLFAHGLASWLVARRVPLLAVDYTERGAASEVSRVYQAPIRFGQPQIGFSFEARWLDLPVVQSPQSLREFLAQAPGNLLVRYRDAGTLSERIRRLLRRRLDLPPPPLEAIATQLAMAPQTLRRHLRDEGQGFQQIKDELRRDAEDLSVRRSHLSISVASSHSWRDRRGQRGPGTRHSPSLASCSGPVHRHQLRRVEREPARSRAVRL